MSGLLFIQTAQANEGYGSATIVSVDMKKNIIDLGELKFKFDSKTVVYDLFGNQVDISVLKSGMSANVAIDATQRYVGYPILKGLYLKSVIE
ncbi:MAG: hypothetical protein OQL06_14950 [Gammaproteobacteria bacterium]|nr:hypothetical protein [Gammaproteobacteria bacterium]